MRRQFSTDIFSSSLSNISACRIFARFFPIPRTWKNNTDKTSKICKYNKPRFYRNLVMKVTETLLRNIWLFWSMNLSYRAPTDIFWSYINNCKMVIKFTIDGQQHISFLNFHKKLRWVPKFLCLYFLGINSWKIWNQACLIKSFPLLTNA